MTINTASIRVIETAKNYQDDVFTSLGYFSEYKYPKSVWTKATKILHHLLYGNRDIFDPFVHFPCSNFSLY